MSYNAQAEDMPALPEVEAELLTSSHFCDVVWTSLLEMLAIKLQWLHDPKGTPLVPSPHTKRVTALVVVLPHMR